MEDNNWTVTLLKLSRAVDLKLGFGKEKNINSLRADFLRYLNSPKGVTNHPELGSVKIKIITTKSNHANLSVSSTPIFSIGWNNKRLLKEAGTPDANGHEFSLKGRIGFSSSPLRLRNDGDTISLLFDEICVGSWNTEVIFEKFSRQSNTLLCRFQYNEEGNWILKVVNLVGLNLQTLGAQFEDLINTKQLSPEFRMFIGESHRHCVDRGIPPGSVRDHGFGWRLKAKLGSELYTTESILGSE